jgi:hypothetical protein
MEDNYILVWGGRGAIDEEGAMGQSMGGLGGWNHVATI